MSDCLLPPMQASTRWTCGRRCPSCAPRIWRSQGTLWRWLPGTRYEPTLVNASGHMVTVEIYQEAGFTTFCGRGGGVIGKPTAAHAGRLRAVQRLKHHVCFCFGENRRDVMLVVYLFLPVNAYYGRCGSPWSPSIAPTRTAFTHVFILRSDTKPARHETPFCVQLNAYCGRCGSPTESIEAGAKRQCTREPRHRVYPRTDAVVRHCAFRPTCPLPWTDAVDRRQETLGMMLQPPERPVPPVHHAEQLEGRTGSTHCWDGPLSPYTVTCNSLSTALPMPSGQSGQVASCRSDFAAMQAIMMAEFADRWHLLLWQSRSHHTASSSCPVYWMAPQPTALRVASCCRRS